MTNKTFLLICSIIMFFLHCGKTFSQDESSIAIKPTIGVGAGMLTYYGDISKNQKENSSIVSRVGYDIRVTQKLNSYLDLNFYFLFGKLGANEKSLTRNLNFESKITAGGLNVSYNFSHLLKEERIVEPYLSLGVESFEFLSKTDRVDANGNIYYYWDDGSIRSLPQNSPNAENAIRLQRDFKYESDIRTLNADSFGKYPERSFAFPIGAGINFLLWDRCSFRVGTALHYTMTDYIEGVTAKSLGDRAGDAKKDKFLFTSFSLTYNLSSKEEEEGEEDDAANLLALANADSDGDGVKDMDDKCAGTPPGAQVNILTGCPLDDDSDGVPNYKDLELATVAGAPVDSNGVTLTDEQLEAFYKKYGSGDGGEYYDTIAKEHVGETTTATVTKKYFVQVGEYSGDIPEDVANMILSIPDAKTWQEGNRTVITVGDYEKLPDAVKRALQMQEGGVADASVVAKGAEGGLQKVDNAGGDVKAGGILDQPGQIVYRVQLGAFSKKLSKNIFSGISDLVAVPGEDGLTRYYSGSFSDTKGAAARKIDLIAAGYEGAFVAAFKDGKRVQEKEESGENKRGVVKKEYIRFRVQVGAYNKDVPSGTFAKFAELGDVEQRNIQDGTTIYFSGKFSNYESAQKHQQKLTEKGIETPFVIGEFKGKIITAQEAIELLEGK